MLSGALRGALVRGALVGGALMGGALVGAAALLVDLGRASCGGITTASDAALRLRRVPGIWRARAQRKKSREGGNGAERALRDLNS